MELALSGDPEIEYSLADDRTTVSWINNPLSDLKTAVELFLDRSGLAQIASREPGARPQVSSIAIRALIGIASDYQPAIEPPALASLCEVLLAPVIEGSNQRHGTSHKCPDWHDRVSQIMKEGSSRSTHPRIPD